MSSIIPPLSSCSSRMTSGERKFARLLEAKLEDDYSCWFDIPVGGVRKRYTDFIVLHARRGLLMLEVKDWKLDTIVKFDPTQFTLHTNNGLKHVSNPLQQVRQCSYALVNALEADKALHQLEGKYSGRLAVPYAYGVVLTNISRADFDAHQFGEVLPEHLVICKDEMKPEVDVEHFQKRLWDMFSVQFPEALSLPQIDRIKWHLFPEIRIRQPLQTDFFNPSKPEPDAPEDLFPSVLEVMDRTQEVLARSMGNGHRVIHGVAGSGKTLILGYRCMQLAHSCEKPILVLCFNVTLAARLRESLKGSANAENLVISHFHDWCGEQLKTYHVEKPPSGQNYVVELVKAVADGVKNKKIPSGQYGAVMIDEGHDFESEWLKLIVSMVDPDTNSLLLLYDDAQSLYKKKDLGFSLSSVGINARGRTTILRINYRNTDEVTNFAFQFARNWLTPGDCDEDHIPMLEPATGGRHGPMPVVRGDFNSFEEEVNYIVRCIDSASKRGTELQDICVCYRSLWMGKVIAEALKQQNIPTQWLKNTQSKKLLSSDQNSVKLMTMHSTKGLEFHFVIVAGTGAMPLKGHSKNAEAKLLYVAMTRSTEKLLITGHKRSEFINQLAA